MNQKQRELASRLWWLESAVKGLHLALGEDVMPPGANVEPTPDPLCHILRIHLKRPLQKNSRHPVRAYLRAWASEGDCELPRIPITDREIRAEILIKYLRRRLDDS